MWVKSGIQRKKMGQGQVLVESLNSDFVKGKERVVNEWSGISKERTHGSDVMKMTKGSDVPAAASLVSADGLNTLPISIWPQIRTNRGEGRRRKRQGSDEGRS
jgi:hypothetical protein